jgi:hypothetical protein
MLQIEVTVALVRLFDGIHGWYLARVPRVGCVAHILIPFTLDSLLRQQEELSEPYWQIISIYD